MKKHGRDWNSFLLFLLGLGAYTKVYLIGVIAFSELATFALAPILFIKYYYRFRKIGVLPILYISLSMIVGCYISCTYNNVPLFAFLKCAATYYSIFSAIVVYSLLLSWRLKGLGWFFFGLAISLIISAFAFNPQAMVDMNGSFNMGQIELDEAMEGPLFWYPKVMAFVKLPIQGFYLTIPPLYSLIMLPLGICFIMLISVSGRSASISMVVSFVIILFGRRSRRSMWSISKHFLSFLIIGICMLYVGKMGYAFFAMRGTLGEEARAKYIRQSQGGKGGLLQILMSGRQEFFITIWAVLDHPLIGIGPYAIDTKGYVESFLFKYGDDADVVFYKKSREKTMGVQLIPQHSYLTQFWGQAGIMGLIFWLYVMWLMLIFFRRYIASIPQWFGYFACAIPGTVWAVFFAPYNERATVPLLIVCLLLARAVGKGWIILPDEFEMEARKYD